MYKVKIFTNRVHSALNGESYFLFSQSFPQLPPRNAIANSQILCSYTGAEGGLVRLCCFLLLCVLSVLPLPNALLAEPPVVFTESEGSSDTGHFTLTWENPAEKEVTLEVSNNPSFERPRALYQGSGTSFFISGLSDGKYYYRLRDVSSEDTEVFILTVAHRSLTLALSLFALGSLVFLAIVAVILRGER